MATNEKLDLFKHHKDEYVASRKPSFVTIERGRYLTIEGKGVPGGEDFIARIGALYGAAFTVKMTRKFAGRGDYVVSRLEAIWWTDAGDRCLGEVPMGEWRWKLLVRTPEFVERAELKEAIAALIAKDKGPEVRDVKLEDLAEGRCVQMLHVGPYDKEPETVAVMEAFADKAGYELHGRHHEIYLSDPRRVPPERLKTILRTRARIRKK